MSIQRAVNEKAVVLAVLLLLLGSTVCTGVQLPAQQRLAIVRAGRASAVIALADSPEKTERFAANELAEYITKMSGAELRILSESAIQGYRGNIILLGDTTVADEFAGKPTEVQVGYDGYLIQTHGKHLVIRGRRPMGTLFGVYRLLEQLGCRFYGPWADSEIIPKLANISIDPVDRFVKPAINYRSASARSTKWSFFFRKRFPEWLVKLGFADVKPMRHAQTYGFHWFMPEDKYYAEHPEWYALHFGKRVRDSGDLCVSNTAMRAEFARNVIAWLKEHPELDVAPINAHDGPARCECELCKELDNPKYPNDMLRRMLVFANDVAQRVTEAMPGKRVGLYGYYAGAHKYPDDIKAHPGILPCFFPTVRPADQISQIDKWMETIEDIYLYYWSGRTQEWSDWLNPAWYSDFEKVTRHKTIMLATEIHGWSPPIAMKIYFLGKKGWDGDYDIKRGQAEYLARSFGPAAEVMRSYFVSHAEAVRTPVGVGFYGPYPPEVVSRLNDFLDRAEMFVKDSPDDFARRIQRERITLKVFSDYCLCRALTARYAQTRMEEDRVKAGRAVDSALALLTSIKQQDVIWTSAMLDVPYRHYHYMESIVIDPPRTRFDQIGEFVYYYDSMYEGPVTLADAVELKNVTAGGQNTLVKANTAGELFFEFLAPPDAVFESVEIRPNAHSVPTNLAAFSVELSSDAGKSWRLLTNQQAESGRPIDVTAQVKSENSFVLRYRGKNETGRDQVFVDCPKVSGRTVAATEPMPQIRYWDGWDKKKLPIPPSAVRLRGTPALPKKLVLFEYEPDLGYWGGGYHQGEEYHVGKGFGDNPCVRMWENEGPGWSGVAGIPTEPGAEYLLTFRIQVDKGQALVATEGNWKPGWPANVGELARTYRHMRVLAHEEHWKRLPLSKAKTFEPSKQFEKAEIEIKIPDTPIDPENCSFTIVFAHKGDGAEFFVDDVVLHKR